MDSVEWSDYDNRYRGLYNSMKTKFKIVTNQTIVKSKAGR
jgi:hypothetical protein